MSRKAVIDDGTFVNAYLPAVRRGESRVTIGKALGFFGTDAEIESKVSAKTTQCRKALKEYALSTAKTEGLTEEKTAERVASYLAKLPRVKQARNESAKGAALVSALDGILSSLDAFDADNLTDNMANPTE
jgi:hypothetical protein